MPNHVTNIITYEGDRKQIAEMLETIKDDELGIGTVSFEKIIPMPEDIYRGNLGQKERELYGDRNWYDWCRANWGTKWNAYGYEDGRDYSNENPLEFLTAWSAPHPVMQKLSEMFLEIEITHEWADEDIGMNCGRHCYLGGECTEEYYPESNFDRVSFATTFVEQLNKKKPKNIEKIKELWYRGNMSDQYRHYSDTRYHALNLHSYFQHHGRM